MAAVRANTMQMITRTKTLSDGQPFAATMRAPRANGSEKIVCENRINRRNRDTAPPGPVASRFGSVEFTAMICRCDLSKAAMFLKKAVNRKREVVCPDLYLRDRFYLSQTRETRKPAHILVVFAHMTATFRFCANPSMPKNERPAARLNKLFQRCFHVILVVNSRSGSGGVLLNV